MASHSQEQVVLSESIPKPIAGDQEVLYSTGHNLEEFTFFSKLPVELRLTIIRLTYPSPRKVVLNVPTTNRPNPTHKVDVQPGRYTTRVPVALHINAETRQEALKTYTVVTKEDFKGAHMLTFGPLLFDIREDTFQFQCRFSPGVVDFEILSRIAIIRPKILSQIRSIEVIADYTLAWCFILDALHIPGSSIFGELAFLSGLEHIIFSVYEEHDQRTSDESLDLLRIDIPRCLEPLKANFLSGCVPVMEVRRVRNGEMV